MKKEEERPSMEDAESTKEPWWNTLAEGIRMPKDTMILAGRLKEARNRRKFVPSFLASLNGVSEARITAWEDGSESFPFEYLECMANSLNVSPVWLWLGDVFVWKDSEATPKGPESFYEELFVNEDGIYVQFALEWYAKQAIQKLPETWDGEVALIRRAFLMIKAIAIDGSAIAENETVMQAIGETVNKVTDVHGEFCVFTNTRNSEILTAVKKAKDEQWTKP